MTSARKAFLCSFQYRAHRIEALRADQRKFADEECRHAAYSALMSRERVVLQAHFVFGRFYRFGHLARVEPGFCRQARDDAGVADVFAVVEVRSIDSLFERFIAARLARKLRCRKGSARVGQHGRRLHRKSHRVSHRAYPLPERDSRCAVTRLTRLVSRNSCRGPIGMNLKTAPFELDIEFGFQLSNRFEADVTERTNVVREHHDLQRHRMTSCAQYRTGAG